VLSGPGAEDDHTMVAVAIGDDQLIRFPIDKELGGSLEIFDVIPAFARGRLADLQQEFAVLRELEDDGVVTGRLSAASGIYNNSLLEHCGTGSERQEQHQESPPV
jgi:hypothetical protein